LPSSTGSAPRDLAALRSPASRLRRNSSDVPPESMDHGSVKSAHLHIEAHRWPVHFIGCGFSRIVISHRLPNGPAPCRTQQRPTIASGDFGRLASLAVTGENFSAVPGEDGLNTGVPRAGTPLISAPISSARARLFFSVTCHEAALSAPVAGRKKHSSLR
jgi:hypothetical protein